MNMNVHVNKSTDTDMGGYNEFKLSSSCYLRLMAGKPQGLILNEKREPIGIFIVTHGLNALKKHCFDPSESKWITLGTIEQKRQEIVGESGRWYDIPLFARDNPWHIVCLALTKEHAALAKEMINNDENSF